MQAKRFHRTLGKTGQILERGNPFKDHTTRTPRKTLKGNQTKINNEQVTAGNCGAAERMPNAAANSNAATCCEAATRRSSNAPCAVSLSAGSETLPIYFYFYFYFVLFFGKVLSAKSMLQQLKKRKNYAKKRNERLHALFNV